MLALHGAGAIVGKGDCHIGIVCRVAYHRHRFVVLRCRTQQRHPTNVNLLDRRCQRHIGLGHRFFEGIEIYHHNVNRSYAMLG